MAEAMQVSNTHVVELAVTELAKHQTPNHALLKHAGILSEGDAQEMLSLIQRHKKSKKEPVEF